MAEINQFLTGYFLWISLSVFLAGLVIHSSVFYQFERQQSHLYFKKLDTLIFFRLAGKWLFKSTTENFLIISLLVIFRIFMIIVPCFLLSHNIVWAEYTGWHLPAFENLIFDFMAIIVIACAVFLFFGDFINGRKKKAALHLLVFLTFITGLLAHYQVGGNYEWMMSAHILTGECLLIYSPFAILRLKVENHN